MRDSLADAEREILVEVLRRCHNNRSAAMRLLGISRQTFYRKLRRHGSLEGPEGRQ
ncbi:MAG: helix-turn-helix domain-containing protein [Desulfotomaculales bacterium]